MNDRTPATILNLHKAKHIEVLVAKSAVVPKTTMDASHMKACVASFWANGDSSPDRGGPERKAERSSSNSIVSSATRVGEEDILG